MKLLIFPKGFYSQDILSKKGNSLNKEIMYSIHTVMRAVRKFKAMASQAKSKEILPIHNLAMRTVMLKKIHNQKSFSRPSISHIYKNSTFSPRVRLNSADSPKEEKKEPISRLLTFSKDLPESSSKVSSPSPKNNESNKKMNSLNSIISSYSENELRKITELKNQKLENFCPNSFRRIRLFSYLYIIIIIILIGTRSLVEVTYIKTLSENVNLLLASKERFEAAIWLNCFMTIYQDIPQDHCVLYEKKVPGIDIRDFIMCRKYITDQLLIFEEQLLRSQKILNIGVRDGIIKNPYMVNPESIKMGAGPGIFVNMSLSNALKTEYTYSVRFRSEFRVHWIFKANYFGNIMDAMPNSMIEISDSIQSNFKTGDNAVLIMLITISLLPTVFFSILIPYMCMIRKKIDSNLYALLEISNNSINAEYEKTMRFIFKISKYFHNIKLSEFNQRFDPETIENESQNSVKENGEQTSQNNQVVLKLHKTEQISHSRNNGHNIQKYNTKIWYTLIFIIILVAVTDAVYILIAYMSREIGNRIIIETNELSRIFAIAYDISILFPTVLSIIMGTAERAETGSTQIPIEYLESITAIVINESYGKLSELIGLHYENRDYFCLDYKEYFATIFRDDVCAIEEDTAPYCYTLLRNSKSLLNNKMLGGAYDVIIAFLSLLKAVLNDCTSKKIPEFSYLFDMLVAWIHVLNPAFISISDRIFEEIDLSYSESVIGNSATFIAIAIVTIFALGLGLKYLNNYMHKELFDSRSLISSLSVDVVKSNKIIYDFVIQSSSNCNDI